MADLEELMKVPAALAAFEFAGSGELTDHRLAQRSPVTREILDLVAHMCAANMSVATMQARGWEHMTGMQGFYPIREFTLVGFDWSIMVSGHHRSQHKEAGSEAGLPPFQGVVLNNVGADYEATYKALEA